MKEDIAKTKWCPMGGRKVVLSNGDLEVGKFAQCLGSECMMWREEFVPSSVDPKYDQTIGYCGLAGKVK